MEQDLFNNIIVKTNDDPVKNAIMPHKEMGAYEALWLQTGATFKTIAEKFLAQNNLLPSDLVSEQEAKAAYKQAMDILEKSKVHRFGIRLHGAGDYPKTLRDAKDPIELLYFQGTWEYVESKCIAIVGTRNPSEEGKLRAQKLAKLLVKNDVTITSGLAAGIDTVAHETAIREGGRTIAVIGTPLGSVYPKENMPLQDYISKKHLLISQIPIVRYSKQKIPQNRLFFPERNKTMSALTKATIIVEAGETSGTLVQARAALYQKRKLLLLDSLFQRQDLTWPRRFEEQGAIRIKSIEDILEHVL